MLYNNFEKASYPLILIILIGISTLAVYTISKIITIAVITTMRDFRKKEIKKVLNDLEEKTRIKEE